MHSITGNFLIIVVLERIKNVFGYTRRQVYRHCQHWGNDKSTAGASFTVNIVQRNLFPSGTNNEGIDTWGQIISKSDIESSERDKRTLARTGRHFSMWRTEKDKKVLRVQSGTKVFVLGSLLRIYWETVFVILHYLIKSLLSIKWKQSSYAKTEWIVWKAELHHSRKSKMYFIWCRLREKILGRGGQHCCIFKKSMRFYLKCGMAQYLISPNWEFSVGQ